MSSDNAKKIPSLFAVPERDAAESLAEKPKAGRRRKEDATPACTRCFGTGYEVVPGKGARRCECRTKNQEGKLLEAARIPRRYLTCTLDKYHPDDYCPEQSNNTQSVAFWWAKQLVKNYHQGVEKGLLFMGPVGVGKTHLSVGILLGLIDQGAQCLFYEFGSLLKTIQDSYNPISHTSELRVLAPVYQADVLVLDELGATMSTDWVRDTIAQIINRRYNDKKLTIFTTNYLDTARIETRNVTLDDMQREIAKLKMEQPRNENERQTLERRVREVQDREQQLTQKTTTEKRLRELTTLEDRIGVSMRSRLYEMCETVMIQGADFRRTLRLGR